MAQTVPVRSASVAGVRTLTQQQARRIAVRAQLLDAHRPDDLLELVRHLTLLQVEPTAAVAPSAHVVAWSRLGAAYRTSELGYVLRQAGIRMPDVKPDRVPRL